MLTTFMRILLAAAGIGQVAAQIDPQHAMNLTVYHLNPAGAGAVPINMDSGDALGDLYFYLGQFLLPLECQNASKAFRAHFDCDNPERVDPNLVVTKVDMEVDSRTTSYSACNLCNGTDPFTHKPCQKGTYTCDCFSHESAAPCNAKRLGNESIADNFIRKPHVFSPQCGAALNDTCGSVKGDAHQCSDCVKLHKSALNASNCSRTDEYYFCPDAYEGCNATAPSWNCWAENIPRKTLGYWFSTIADGMCNETTPVGGCGWKVLSTTTVKNTCVKHNIINAVELAGSSCFKGCGPRDTNSSCWIGCFFDTLLGPQAAHSNNKTLGGMPIGNLEKAWKDSFQPVAEGGCAKTDVSGSWMPLSKMMLV